MRLLLMFVFVCCSSFVVFVFFCCLDCCRGWFLLRLFVLCVLVCCCDYFFCIFVVFVFLLIGVDVLLLRVLFVVLALIPSFGVAFGCCFGGVRCCVLFVV